MLVTFSFTYAAFCVLCNRRKGGVATPPTPPSVRQWVGPLRIWGQVPSHLSAYRVRWPSHLSAYGGQVPSHLSAYGGQVPSHLSAYGGQVPSHLSAYGIRCPVTCQHMGSGAQSPVSIWGSGAQSPVRVTCQHTGVWQTISTVPAQCSVDLRSTTWASVSSRNACFSCEKRTS